MSSEMRDFLLGLIVMATLVWVARAIVKAVRSASERKKKLGEVYNKKWDVDYSPRTVGHNVRAKARSRSIPMPAYGSRDEDRRQKGDERRQSEDYDSPIFSPLTADLDSKSEDTSYHGHGGSFGGAGASGSWGDSHSNHSHDTGHSSHSDYSSHSDHSSSYDSGSSYDGGGGASDSGGGGQDGG